MVKISLDNFNLDLPHNVVDKHRKVFIACCITTAVCLVKLLFNVTGMILCETCKFLARVMKLVYSGFV